MGLDFTNHLDLKEDHLGEVASCIKLQAVCGFYNMLNKPLPTQISNNQKVHTRSFPSQFKQPFYCKEAKKSDKLYLMYTFIMSTLSDLSTLQWTRKLTD